MPIVTRREAMLACLALPLAGLRTTFKVAPAPYAWIDGPILEWTSTEGFYCLQGVSVSTVETFTDADVTFTSLS
jgi:hypothetical protein